LDQLVLVGLAQPKIKISRKNFIIYPNDIKKICWEVLISIILLCSCFTTPYNLAFPQLEDNNKWYRIANFAMDGLFFVDIIINFCSAVEDESC